MPQRGEKEWVYEEVIDDELEKRVHAECGKAQGMKHAIGEDGAVEDESLHSRRDGHGKECVARTHFRRLNFQRAE